MIWICNFSYNLPPLSVGLVVIVIGYNKIFLTKIIAESEAKKHEHTGFKQTPMIAKLTVFGRENEGDR